MKPYMIPVRLFKEDLERKAKLIAYYSAKWGKKAAYADIVRELQREKVEEIEKGEV